MKQVGVLVLMMVLMLGCVVTPTIAPTVAPPSPTVTVTAEVSPIETPGSPVETPTAPATETPEPTMTVIPVVETPTPGATVISPLRTPETPVVFPETGEQAQEDIGMEWNFGAIAILLGVVLLGERLVEALQPLFKPLLQWLEQWLPVDAGWPGMVFSWVFLSVMVWFAGLNVFGEQITPWVGRVLTALIAGGGANLLHDLWPGKTVQR